jgi:hypothetical protein
MRITVQIDVPEGVHCMGCRELNPIPYNKAMCCVFGKGLEFDGDFPDMNISLKCASCLEACKESEEAK